MQQPIDPQAIARLRTARKVVVLTGAGVSAESGVPTFRDAQTGLWARYDPTELATPQAFQHNPQLVWDWYAYRRQMTAAAQPNPAHFALAALEQRYPAFTLITQNVDGLHRRAGSRAVIELHGNIARVRCFDCAAYAENWDEAGELPPRCTRCGGMLRPDVVWFGEMLPQQELGRAYAAARQAEVFLAVGTSAVVQPAASLPLLAQNADAYLIEVNPAATDLTPLVDCWLNAPAGVALPALLQLLNAADEPAGAAS